MPELNDLFDCAPIIGPLDGETGYKDKDFTKEIIKGNPLVFGLLCFSRISHNPLLWGHYADSARGIALGFDPEFFDGRDGRILEHFNVVYDPENMRPVFRWPADEAIPPDMMKELVFAGFGTKAKDWKYEEEVRYILNLEKCKAENGMYFYPFQLAR